MNDDPYSWLLFFVKPITLDVAISLIFVILLLIISALISASEVAYFSLSPEKLKIKTYAAEKIQQQLRQPKKLLAVILIANQFVNIGIAILSNYTINEIFDFSNTPLLGLIFNIIIITSLILLIGEIIPKVYATQKAYQIAAFMAYPINILSKLFSPFVYLLVSTSSFIDKRLKKKERKVSIEELSHALDITTDTTASNHEEEHKILKGIVEFGNIEVRQIMQARVDTVAIDISTDFKSLLQEILDKGYSRMPVYKENFDHVEGILYIKDLLPYTQENENFNWQKLIRKAFFVPENKKINDLLKEFQENKIHMAIVVDEYGGCSGIVTMEDIIEEIVGEINDEFDEDDVIYSKLDEHNFIFDGKIPLTKFFRIVDYDEDKIQSYLETSETLAGLVLEIAGKLPQKNELVENDDFMFKIESIDKRRIKRIKVTIKYGHNKV